MVEAAIEEQNMLKRIRLLPSFDSLIDEKELHEHIGGFDH